MEAVSRKMRARASQVHAAIQGREHEHVEGADARRLRRGEPPAEDPAEDQDRRAHRRERAQQRPPRGRPVVGLADEVRSPARPDPDGGRERDRHQDGGDHRRGEQGTGGHRGDGREDDRRDARRHDRADERGAGAQADRELRRVALLAHVVDLDRPDAGRVGERGAAHPREPEADADVDVREARAERAQQHEHGVVQARGDLGARGHDPDQDEQRDGQQRPAVDAADHEPDGEPEREPLGDQVREAGAQDGERHRDAQEEQEDDRDEEEDEAHATHFLPDRISRRSCTTMIDDGAQGGRREAEGDDGVDDRQRDLGGGGDLAAVVRHEVIRRVDGHDTGDRDQGVAEELDRSEGTHRQDEVDHLDRDVLVVRQEVAGHEERRPDHRVAGHLAGPRPPAAGQVALEDLHQHEGEDDGDEDDPGRLLRPAEPAQERAEGLRRRKDLRRLLLAEPVRARPRRRPVPVAGRLGWPSPVPRQAWTHGRHQGHRGMRRRRTRTVPASLRAPSVHSPYCAVDRIASRITTCSGVKFSRR